MNTAKTAYLALGSNKGNKLQYMQAAVDAVFKRVGAVKKLSKVYKTPAVGFDGDDFYNACIKVETELKPKKLLAILKQIETDLGRAEKTKGTYQSREIDLDIIFYAEEVIEQKDLIIPHPELHNRKFVLEPLCDILKE